jgi:hypothetical protein
MSDWQRRHNEFCEAMEQRRRQSSHVHFVAVEISSQIIGEPTTGVWCSTCQLPSAIIVDLAMLILGPGEETYDVDPVKRLVTMWSCVECGGAFELPDSPSLVDNRD